MTTPLTPPGAGRLQVERALEALADQLSGQSDDRRKELLALVSDWLSHQKRESGADGSGAQDAPTSSDQLPPRPQPDDLLESIHDGFFALDRGWRYTYINRRAAEPLGYEPAELIGMNLWETFPRIVGTDAETHYRRAMEAGEASQYRVQGVYSQRWYDVNVYPAVDGITVYTVDRTEQVAAEQALRESERRLRVALSCAPVTIYNIDRDLRYTWVYDTLYGIPADQATGRRDDELLPSAAAEALTAFKEEVLRSGQSLQKELSFSTGDGERCYILSLEPVKDAAGAVVGITGTSFDITQVRSLEAQQIEHLSHLKIQQRLLEYREKERQNIARELHDGPLQDLSSLIFSIQYAKEAFQECGMQLELEQISSNLRETVRDLRGMINDLRPPSLIRFGLSKAIRFHAEDFSEKRPDLSIQLTLAEDGSRLSEQARLSLFRIYQESLNNVVRHANARTITITLDLVHESIQLTIRDDGCGFVVVPDLTEHTQSGHFGLAGMKERAEAIGGAFLCESQPGAGTTVCVRCPLGEEALAQ